jgi:hypothetical protein
LCAFGREQSINSRDPTAGPVSTRQLSADRRARRERPTDTQLADEGLDILVYNLRRVHETKSSAQAERFPLVLIPAGHR